jgi:large subunit ribosomal protein L22
MDIVSRTKFIRISPTKTRLVADLIRGKHVEEAVTILTYTHKKAARILQKTLHAALASAKEKVSVDIDTLKVAEIRVDGGPVLKRFMPCAMGRASKIRHRTSHNYLRLSEDY